MFLCKVIKNPYIFNFFYNSIYNQNKYYIIYEMIVDNGCRLIAYSHGNISHLMLI